METTIAVGLVDNDALTLGALRALLARANGVRVMWAVGDGAEALDLCRDPHSRPDVLLVDMSMEPMPGAVVCERLRGAGLTVGLVCVTSFALETYAARAAAAGAQAIVSKTDMRGMLAAVARAAKGLASPSPVPGVAFRDVAAAIGDGCGDHGGSIVADGDATLSARELQIIRMVADGMETEEISRSLSLSRYTVATYLKRACGKLGARNRVNLVAVCERRGLL